MKSGCNCALTCLAQHRLRVVVVLVAAVACGVAFGREPPVGSVAPKIRLSDIDGRPFDMGVLKPRTRVIIFGDLSHAGVRAVCERTVDVVGQAHFAGDGVLTMLVVQGDKPEAVREAARGGHLPSVVLLDPERRTLADYHVLVMPTVVIVDSGGTVRYAMSGPVQRFEEKLAAALDLSAGRISEQQFKKEIAPGAREVPEGKSRASRLTRLGAELARHGLLDVAEARFREAIALAPESAEAKLGLAAVLTRAGRLDDAEVIYREVAAQNADSVDAAVGLATVGALRGGDDLDKAEVAASELVAKYPSRAQVRFLMGLIYERKGNCPAAVGEFKRAAELLIGN